MPTPIIEVHGLSKRYRIGAAKERYLSLRAELAKKARRISSVVSRLSSSIQHPASFSSHPASSISPTDLWALKDVSFSVQEGETIGIIGRNGAGKSTLLKILSQITPPTEGTITMRGRVASLLEVGTGFHEELTGRENIYLNGAILGMTRKEIARKFDEIVAFSEMEKFLDTPVKHYSSGMQVRLAFAVAAHLEPEILIVDEVLAVGDAEFQKKCMGKMGNVAKEGRTVLFVSHNMGAIEYLCQKCILIEKGQIIKFSNDVHSVIRQYIGSGLLKKGSEFDWNKLENKHFRLLDFSLRRKSDHQEMDVFSKGDDIEIELLIDVYETNPNLSIGYALFDSERNICLWWSFHIDSEPIILKSGENILRTTIPKGMLNERTYRVEFLAAIHNQGWLISPGSRIGVEFKVKGGTIGSLKFASTRREIPLMPLFPWKNEFIAKKD
jgi:lipopolysaccharide transport system ATP-binding protein